MKRNFSRRELEAMGEPINPELPTRLNRIAGGGGKGSAPPTPDFQSLADMQAKSSMDVTQYQTHANRPTINTPYGTQSWEVNRDFDQAGWDAAQQAYMDSYVGPTEGYYKQAGPGGDQGYEQVWVPGKEGTYTMEAPNREDFYGPEQWTMNTELTPEAQKALDSQMAMQQGRSDIALGLMPQAQEAITTPIDYDSMQSWSSAPTSSDFQSYENQVNLSNAPDVANLQSYTGTPDLQNIGNAPELQKNLRTDNLQDVNALTRNDITDMPQFDQNYVNMVKNQTLDYMRPDMQAEEQALEAKLAAQGLRPGSEAYDRAMRRLADQQSRDEYNALRLGMDQGNTMYRNQMAANNQLFGQRRDVFNSELAANRNQFGQNQAVGQFRNAALSAQNQMNLANLGFNNQNALALDQAGFRNRQQANDIQNTLYNQRFQNNAFNNQNQLSMDSLNRQDNAYANALKQQTFDQQMQNAGFNNQVRQGQIAEAIQRQQVPLNNINALMNGQQVSMPNMPAFNQAQRAQAAQYLNAGQMQYNADLQAQQMNNASANSFMNGAFQLGGTLGGAYLGNPAAFGFGGSGGRLY